MTKLKIFESPEFGTVRTVTINGEPWLVGKDVAEALGYSKPHKAISCYVDGKDKTVAKVSTSGGDHAAIAINETGVYTLALNSPLNNAKDVTERLVSYFKESACKCSTGSSTEAAFFALSKAYAMGKKDAVQLVEKVRAEFCNQDHFDQVVWDLSCAVLECVAIENRCPGGRHGPHVWGVRQPRHGGQDHGGKPADRGQAAAGGGAGIRAPGGGAGAIHRGAAGDGTGHGASPVPQRAAHRCAGGGFCPD